MAKNPKKGKISQKPVLSDPIPQLSCVQMPHSGANDGIYEVSIPLKYMVAAYERPAAYFVFKFVGLRMEGKK